MNDFHACIIECKYVLLPNEIHSSMRTPMLLLKQSVKQPQSYLSIYANYVCLDNNFRIKSVICLYICPFINVVSGNVFMTAIAGRLEESILNCIRGDVKEP